MFITNEAGKLPVPSALCDEGSSYWTYVKLHLHVPWFYCVYTESYEDEREFRHMVFLSRPSQLNQLALMSGIDVVDIQVVLPAYMTGQGRWIMAPLASVWEGETPEYGDTEQMYTTVDGRRFCTNTEITDENQLIDKQLVYQSPLK
jgi:hypothetical protein